MAVSRSLALLALAVAAIVVAPCQGSQLGSPLYVVSNTKTIGQGTPAQVQYQTKPASAIVESLVSQKAAQTSADHVTVVFVGCQGKAPIFTELAALADLVGEAASSAVYVNAEQAATPAALKDGLEAALQSSGVEYATVGCGGGDHKLADATQSTLLVCSTCADEVEQLQQLQLQYTQAERQYTLVYAPAPDSAAAAAPISSTRKRLLQSTAAPTNFTCDAICRTQVKWLEGVLAAMLMVTALFSGLGCLYFLETPTKFLVPKEQ